MMYWYNFLNKNIDKFCESAIINTSFNFIEIFIMKTVIVTKDSLQKMLDSNDINYVIQVIGRALVVIMNQQTDDEKQKVRTIEHNGIGFTGSDAKSGTLTAKSFLKNKTLTEWQIEKWLKKNSNGYSRLVKYHAQLNRAAIRKSNKTL